MNPLLELAFKSICHPSPLFSWGDVKDKRDKPICNKCFYMLSPKIIYFDSMKNLTHAMNDMNIADSLKASVFYLGENFTSCSFQWIRRGLS